MAGPRFDAQPDLLSGRRCFQAFGSGRVLAERCGGMLRITINVSLHGLRKVEEVDLQKLSSCGRRPNSCAAAGGDWRWRRDLNPDPHTTNALPYPWATPAARAALS